MQSYLHALSETTVPLSEVIGFGQYTVYLGYIFVRYRSNLNNKAY